MKFLKILSIVILLLMAILGGAVWRLKEVLFPADAALRGNNVPGEETSGVTLNFDRSLGTVNVLIVGLDDVDGGRRSDAIALAIFDQDNKEVRIASIPRDTRVQIRGHGWDKINHSYAYGGVDLLKETIMNMIGVDINYFVVVNYQSFPRIIDLLGGIDINVEKRLLYTDYSAKLFINIPRGQQHMNGKTALEYVRFRHDPLGDIGRVQRQQKFMSIVMDKLKSPSIITKIPSLVDEVIDAVNTDLTPMEALRLAQYANSLPTNKIELFMAPGKATYIGELSYWIVDIPELSLMLAGKAKEVPGLEVAASDDLPVDLTPEGIVELVQQIGQIAILNGDGASGLGKRAAQAFQKLGINVPYTGNAKHFDYRTSKIIYPVNSTEDNKLAADALAKLCGITNKGLITRDRSASMVSIILGHDKENIFGRLESASVESVNF